MTAPGPLNLFQRLLRQWDLSHPYNAAQAIHVRGSIDQSKATETWHDTLRSMGLGRVCVDGGTFHYQSANGIWRNRAVTVVPPL